MRQLVNLLEMEAESHGQSLVWEGTSPFRETISVSTLMGIPKEISQPMPLNPTTTQKFQNLLELLSLVDII